jgi:hypothetical protein
MHRSHFFWEIFYFLRRLTPGPLLQMAKTPARLLPLMGPDFPSFSFSAARHIAAPLDNSPHQTIL